MPRYNVHLFPIVRVKVIGIEADTASKAEERAYGLVDMHKLFDDDNPSYARGTVDWIEYAEDDDGALIDEMVDGEIRRSEFTIPTSVAPLLNACKELLEIARLKCSPLDADKEQQEASMTRAINAIQYFEAGYKCLR